MRGGTLQGGRRGGGALGHPCVQLCNWRVSNPSPSLMLLGHCLFQDPLEDSRGHPASPKCTSTYLHAVSYLHRGVPIRLSAGLSKETLQARRDWQEMFKVMKSKAII